MNVTRAIQILRDYKENYIGYPSLKAPKEKIEQTSYSLWAIDEIIDRIVDEASKLPQHITGRMPITYCELIEEFISEMDYLSETTTDYQKRFIFLVARDTSNDLLLFLKGDYNVESEFIENW